MAIIHIPSFEVHTTPANDGTSNIPLDAFLTKQSYTLLSPCTSRSAKIDAANQLKAYAPSSEKEAELFAIMRSSSNPAQKDWAWNRLCQSVYPTIYFLAREYHCKYPMMEESELLNCGMVGLQKALEKYNPAKSKGAKFSTYAYHYIKHAISDECIKFSSAVTPSKPQVKRINKLLETKKAFEIQYGRTPSVEELKERLPKYSKKYIKEHMNGMHKTISIDDPANPSDPASKTTVLDNHVITHSNDSTDNNEKNKYIAYLFDNIACLDRRTQDILNYHFGLNGTPKLKLEEIGKLLNISMQSVSRLEKAGLTQLRALMTMPESVA